MLGVGTAIKIFFNEVLGVSIARVVVFALLGFGLVLGWMLYHRSVYNAGWNDALTSVAAQNGLAAGAASRVRLGVTQCFDKGGSWNVRLGDCDLP